MFKSLRHAVCTRRGAVARSWLAVTLALAGNWTQAQTISDVPMAVKNNVPPNFMFMIDNSGSMSNIVPEAPYDAATDYTPAGCAGSNVLGNGSVVELRVVLGAPRIGSNLYRHWSLASSGSDRRCFARNTIYAAKLLADLAGGPSGYLDADYDGNYLNWYFGTSSGPVTGWSDRKKLSSGAVKTRMEIAKASANSVIGGLPLSIASTTQPAVRVGLSTYDGSDGGRLVSGMADLNSGLVTTLQSQINGLSPGGNTPLAETLADIGRYFATGYSGNITAGSVTGVPINDFLKQDGRGSCLDGANCLTTTTDATPAPAVGTPSRPIQYWCQRNYVFMLTDGRPNADQALQNNTYLRDYDGDCSGANAPKCAGGFDKKIAQSYEPEGSDYLNDVAKALFDADLRPNLVAPIDPATDQPRPKKSNLRTYTIGFADLQVKNDPLLVSTAMQGDGLALFPQDSSELTLAFSRVVSDAFAKDAAAAAVSVANSQISLNNVGYASSYNSGSWYGDLVATSLDTSTGLQTGGNLWSLQTKLDATTPSSRKIVSFNGSQGRAFTAANFPSLSAGVVNWVRGDRTGEGTTYRRRSHLLGDIINAEPLVVTYSGNVPILFQGANDGMLHVVDGRTSASATTRGEELWAYVPKLVHGNLASLAATTYAHKYFVDGTPAAADITGAGLMTKILVGALGKGGRGYYALDITDYGAATEAAAAAKVKWEFSAANMGYSFGTPLIVKTSAGWRVVVASGYDNGTASGGDGRGYVWVLDPATGAIQGTIGTGVGSSSSPSGLAHLSRLANTAPDYLTRYVYGGDLRGNVWRFDLDNMSATQIAALRDTTGNAQPVTAPPEVGVVAGGSPRYLVYVGTGQYLSDGDVPGVTGANSVATQRQTLYGIVDNTTVNSPSMPDMRGLNGSSCPSGGGNADFVCQSLTYNASTEGYNATTYPTDFATRRGWYLDLPSDANLSNGRVTGKPALTSLGTLAVVVNVPTSTRCEPGGSSWLLALSSTTGGAVSTTPAGDEYYSAGFFLGNALGSRPVIVQTANGKRALVRMSDLSVRNPLIPEPASLAQWRRVYWRSAR